MSQINEISNLSAEISEKSAELAIKAQAISEAAMSHGLISPLIFGFFVFVLACFVGYFVVWKVTPALHTPLMAVTNAISGVIIVGAMIALGSAQEFNIISIFSFIAIIIASINIFGGFFVTWRMLAMFKKK
jgi:H+-translocating NAD(P) transhydrogenase subunit alpha